MGMFLPADISQRVTMFIEGKLEFPFIMDSNFTKENYTKRVLEISIDLQDNTENSYSIEKRKRRIAGDPRILMDCFAQHIAWHKHDQFFEIFGPLKENQLPITLRRKL